MSFGHFRGLMQREAQRADMRTAVPRFGKVTAYNPDIYAVKVKIQPEDFETGWLPVGSTFVGNNWGLFAGPSVGDVVEVHFQEGSQDAGYVTLRFFGDLARPLAAPSAEFWLVHKSGSKIKFTNDGSVELFAAETLRLAAKNVKIHASQTFKFDANGQGQKWDGQGVETWQDDDATKPHHNHAPPEIP